MNVAVGPNGPRAYKPTRPIVYHHNFHGEKYKKGRGSRGGKGAIATPNFNLEIPSGSVPASANLKKILEPPGGHEHL